MATVFSAHFLGWGDYEQIIEEMGRNLPHLKRQFLERVGERLTNSLRSRAADHTVTGSYLDAITHEVSTTDDPLLSIFLRRTDERLSIYWKVLEWGAKPSPVNVTALAEWAGMKFGDPSAGLRIARYMRKHGISPNPILQSVFLLHEDAFLAYGLTSQALETVREAAVEFMQGLETFWTGQVRRRSPVTGRFIPF